MRGCVNVENGTRQNGTRKKRKSLIHRRDAESAEPHVTNHQLIGHRVHRKCVNVSMRSLPLRPDGCALSGQGGGAVSLLTFHVAAGGSLFPAFTILAKPLPPD